MFKLTIVFLALCLYTTQAAVIKAIEEKDLLETTTAIPDSVTTLASEVTTVTGEDFTTTTTERSGGLSRDEEATILILDQTLLDPAPAELIKTEAESVEVEKSGKLLLLSTPKIAEKPKELEENLEESEELDESVQNVTEPVMETTTLSTDNEELTTISLEDEVKTKEVKVIDEDNLKSVDEQITETTIKDVMATAEKTTKLYPINDTLYEENKPMTNTETVESPSLVVDEQPKDSLNSNFGSIVLEESEADYVLVDSEILEGSYADADSELHLQPIVQSVEIVPSSLDDSLLVSYVHSW